MVTASHAASRPLSLWRDTICPKEHGSWSLAFEPIALSLLVAPSVPGAWLAVSLGAAFFARRPLRLVCFEKRADRRAAAGRALALCGATALTAFFAAVATGGVSGFVWLAPAALAGAFFVCFDARGADREEPAELAGAAAFALTPIAFAAVAGAPVAAALALGVVMTGRAAPSVAVVRAFLRATKTGERRAAFALFATSVALAANVWLAVRGLAPWFAVAAGLLLALRAFALLAFIRPSWRARTLGMIEAILGVAVVLGLAATWNL